MTGQVLNPAEALRDPETVMEPDPRTGMFVGQVPPSLKAHHADIACIQLTSAVPESIAIQFETARNLYLYAWHVFRFYTVSQTQALTTLEFGLRKRLPDRLPEKYQRARQKRPMLAGMLSYAIDHGLVRNEGFRRWHAAVTYQARERRLMEAGQAMSDQGLESIEVDETEPAEILPVDQVWDLVQVLRESMPHLRNELAHGSTLLTRQALGTLELVAEILNQLYPSDPSP